jgi:hypothetical protein
MTFLAGLFTGLLIGCLTTAIAVTILIGERVSQIQYDKDTLLYHLSRMKWVLTDCIGIADTMLNNDPNNAKSAQAALYIKERVEKVINEYNSDRVTV